MHDVVACVVAYNRAHLLPDVLGALTTQMAAADVLVIDNASTDGTADVVAGFSGVRYFNTGANLGGAGGFAWALELAAALGYRYAYLLDDDAVPSPGAVAVLRDAASALIEREGLAFLASEPVSPDGRAEPVGMPMPSKSWRLQRIASAHGAIAVEYAAFLGILVPVAVVREHGLPRAEFFIWCDDLEYTRRIAQARGAACVVASTIVHESAAMESAGRGSLGWKYFYLVRNRLWLARWGLPRSDRGHRLASVLMAITATRDELLAGPVRPALLRTALRAWREGLFTPRPAPRPVGSLLDGAPAAAAWLVHQTVHVDAAPQEDARAT